MRRYTVNLLVILYTSSCVTIVPSVCSSCKLARVIKLKRSFIVLDYNQHWYPCGALNHKQWAGSLIAAHMSWLGEILENCWWRSSMRSMYFRVVDWRYIWSHVVACMRTDSLFAILLLLLLLLYYTIYDLCYPSTFVDGRITCILHENP